LKRNLHLNPYKIQLAQELKPNDYLLHSTFINWLLYQLKKDQWFNHKILFSDEAHFRLNGHRVKQNCRIWGNTNPLVVHKSPLHSEKVTVWCDLHVTGIIEPYLFQNATGSLRSILVDKDQ